MEPDWHDYYLVHDELDRWTDSEVDAVEAALGLQLPPGYRELVTTLGSGVINDFVRVGSREQNAEHQALFQDMIRTTWSYEESDDEYTQDRALESAMIAASLDGDMVAFHPVSRRLYVLPRHYERIYSVGTHMRDVVAWLLESGTLLPPTRFRYFESFVGPREAANGAGSHASIDQLAAAIRSLGVHDVEDQTEGSVTFFVKAISGYLTFTDYAETDIYTHFCYITDRSPEVRELIRETAVAAGVTFSSPWSMGSAPES